MSDQTPEPVETDEVETEATTNDLSQQQGEVWVDSDQSTDPQEDFEGEFDPDVDQVEDAPIDGADIDDEAPADGAQ